MPRRQPLKLIANRDSDPFLKMIENNKTYGFTIAVKELRETVPNIFRYASAYKRMNNLTSQGLWEMFVEKEKDEDKKDLPKDDPKHKKQLRKKSSTQSQALGLSQILTQKAWKASRTTCVISGVTLRLLAWIGSEAKSTMTFSMSWIAVADSGWRGFVPPTYFIYPADFFG